MWLLGGGILYTVGMVIYAVRRPDLFPGVFGSHEVFCMFVLAGSIVHFAFMMRYMLPVTSPKQRHARTFESRAPTFQGLLKLGPNRRLFRAPPAPRTSRRYAVKRLFTRRSAAQDDHWQPSVSHQHEIPSRHLPSAD